MTRPRMDSVLDDLLAHGETAATTAQLAERAHLPAEQVRVRMQRLVREGKAFSPARGLWIPIPPQYRTWRVVPGLEFLDQMLTHLSREYYVGWLSAAELYGAAHQRPMVLQVAVDRPVADRDVERVRLRFAQRAHVATVPRARRTVATGQVWVSSPEVTALDLAADPHLGGGVSNVATVLGELAQDSQLRGDLLAEAAGAFSLATVRRLGFLLESVDAHELAGHLRMLTEARRSFPADPLSPGSERDGPLDSRWRLLLNADVEPDL